MWPPLEVVEAGMPPREKPEKIQNRLKKIEYREPVNS